jgi:hypothetical protein
MESATVVFFVEGSGGIERAHTDTCTAYFGFFHPTWARQAGPAGICAGFIFVQGGLVVRSNSRRHLKQYKTSGSIHWIGTTDAG